MTHQMNPNIDADDIEMAALMPRLMKAALHNEDAAALVGIGRRTDAAQVMIDQVRNLRDAAAEFDDEAEILLHRAHMLGDEADEILADVQAALRALLNRLKPA
jgi:hypothetical protein